MMPTTRVFRSPSQEKGRLSGAAFLLWRDILGPLAERFPRVRLVLIILVAAVTACARQPTVAASELPKPVTEAVVKAFPDAVIIAADKSTDSGNTIYHVQFKTLETLRQCDVTADGIVQEQKRAP
jgi:hypothetical protein